MFLTARQEKENQEAEISRIRVEMAALQKVWQQLDVQASQHGQDLKVSLSSSLEELRSAIRQWEEKNLLIASQPGVVVFSDFWAEQAYVKEGQEIFNIVPELDQKVIGQMRVPVLNSGKLKEGQSVEVYLENYPVEEFGKLKGNIEHISKLPKEGRYNVLITFGEALITDYGRKIPFQQQLQGRAEVITEEMSLLERLFHSMGGLNSTT